MKNLVRYAKMALVLLAFVGLMFFIFRGCDLMPPKGVCWGDETEEFCCASDYEIYQGDIPSKIIPNLKVEGKTYFRCPANESIILKYRPKHGKPFKCGGYRFVIYGNGIIVLGKTEGLTK